MTEPIAYINIEERKLEWATPIKWETPTVVKLDKIPLYTKREWVGLTDKEIKNTKHHMVDGAYDYSFKQGAQWAEAVLKEKNGG